MAIPENINIYFSHSIEIDSQPEWLTVCYDTAGYLGDRVGRLVPDDLAGECGGAAVQQPCIFVAVTPSGTNLRVLSLDGSQKLRCYCEIDWTNRIVGLHCHKQMLFIAQTTTVMVTDLSGRILNRICQPDFASGLLKINGIGASDTLLCLCSYNFIDQYYKSSAKKYKCFEALSLFYCDFGGMVVYKDNYLVIDRKMQRVLAIHKSETRSPEVNLNPTDEMDWWNMKSRRCLFHVFKSGYKSLFDIAINSKGLLFVSDNKDHFVDVFLVDGDQWVTLGTRGVSGSGARADTLNRPAGLAVVTGGPQEQLLVADQGNRRIAVFNIEWSQ